MGFVRFFLFLFLLSHWLNAADTSPCRVKLQSIGRSVEINKPIHLTRLSPSKRLALLKELAAAGHYVDFFDPDENAFYHGRVSAVGQFKLSKGVKAFELNNGHSQHLVNSVPSIILRKFARQFAQDIPVFAEVNLELEKRLSGVPKKTLQEMKRKSLGLITIQNLLEHQKWRDFANGAYLLGIDSQPYAELAEALEMTHFEEAYDEFGIREELHQYDEGSLHYPDHTELFMERLYGKIVFLLPRHFLQYEIQMYESEFGDRGITRREFAILMKWPSLKNVVFILGAYDFILEEGSEKAFKKALKKSNSGWHKD